MTRQIIINSNDNYKELDAYLNQNKIRRIFLVCGASIKNMKLNPYFDELPDRLKIQVVRFSGFQPNPTYESVEEGVRLFRNAPCDLIVAVGGGSAMDVAKCIKLFSNMDMACNYLEQDIILNDVKLLAVPTTAGTGSEATRFAVIYYKGEKQSVSDESCIPSAVLFDASTLSSLPVYHRKSAMLDALCHAVESFWSVNSTEESKEYSEQAIKIILEYMDSYLANEWNGNEKMLEASNLAGKAINITQTTAGHAMCYKLTTLLGIAHGHAAALCVSKLWYYMLEHQEECVDSRGKDYLQTVFADLAVSMGCKTSEEAARRFNDILDALLSEAPCADENMFEILKNSVNQERLKNHPVALSTDAIDMIYHQILQERGL